MSEQQYLARTKSFIRRGSRLGQTLQNTWDAQSDNFVVKLQSDGGQTTVAPGQRLNLAKLFGNDNPVVVEVGCGAGDQLVAGAKKHPELNFLGFEVWHPGVAKTISKAVKAKVENIRLIEADASQALPILLDYASVSEVWTFFPDPWHKSRHQKRRLIKAEFAAVVAGVLGPEGKWRIATDWEDYAIWARDVIAQTPYFDNAHQFGKISDEDLENGFAPRWEGRILTRFEQRGLDAGRRIYDICAIRRQGNTAGEDLAAGENLGAVKAIAETDYVSEAPKKL